MTILGLIINHIFLRLFRKTIFNSHYLQKVFAWVILFFSLSISGCDLLPEEEEEDTESSTMFYSVSGNTLTVNCTYDYLGGCESYGTSSLGHYSNWSDCHSDMNNVLDTWKNTGQVKAGPNSDGGGYNNGGGGTGNCDASGYNGPDFNIQVDAQCKAAYYYDCIGNNEGRDASCTLYYDYGNSVWTGSGSLPTCPYCN